MLLKDIERVLQDKKQVNQVVYDLDIDRNVVMETHGECSAAELSCDSERFVLTFCISAMHLRSSLGWFCFLFGKTLNNKVNVHIV